MSMIKLFLVASHSHLYATGDVHVAIDCHQKCCFTNVPMTPVPVRVPIQRPLVPSFTSVVGWVENFSPLLRKLLSTSLWSLLHSPFSSLLGPNTRLRILFSNTLTQIIYVNHKRYYRTFSYSSSLLVVILPV